MGDNKGLENNKLHEEITFKEASILIVEDNPNVNILLKKYLENLSFKIIISEDGEEGFKCFKESHFDLCIIDIMLPKMDGFNLVKKIREIDENVPIVFLTAKAFVEDRIKGFEAGCDDYITKPFSTRELGLRINAILKRYLENKGNDNEVVYHIGKFVFDYTNLNLTIDNTTQILTRKEASLLKLFCDNKNKLILRKQIMKEIWGKDDYYIGRSMDVFITKIRKHLKADPNISITNVHGSGFKLEENN